MMHEPVSAEEIVCALARKYSASTDELRRSVDAFLRELEKEALVKRVHSDGPGTSAFAADGQANLTFEPPSLAAFRDLENLFLLDPVHDVGEEGWPQPQTEPRHP
jgi:Coenzyme PQQ synthesis protein D (PqqD)